MPLFSRPEADLVRDEAPERLMMPHVSWGRNASAVYHAAEADITHTRTWLRVVNDAAPGSRASTYHLFLWSAANALHEFPKLNRFVSGGRLYQRREVVLALSVRRADRIDAELTTLKLVCDDPDEGFEQFSARVCAAIAAARADERSIDRELALGARLPHLLVRGALTGYRLLDRMNLLPQRWQESDPSFSSLFVAHLGSVGLGPTWHHLFELGTNSLFVCLGRIRVERLPDGRVRRLLPVNWTFDERIADGAYCARALRRVMNRFEHPQRYTVSDHGACAGNDPFPSG